MNWEQSTPAWPSITPDQLPSELLAKLERLTEGATLNKVRLRWLPYDIKTRKSFVTKDRLLNISDRSCEEIAVAVVSYAVHLHEQGLCESRFEAQVHRTLDEPNPAGSRRNWRSLTFYVPDSKVDQFPRDETDDEDEEEAELDAVDELDEDEQEDDDIVELFPPAVPSLREPPPPSRRALPRARVSARPRAQSSLGSLAAAQDFDRQERLVNMSREDPNGFAMLVMQQTHDMTVGLLTDLLYASTERVDTILATQVSGSRYLNEALNTITHGAGRIAGLGVQLFERGMESRARVVEEERETVLGRERNEITRDAIKQGSLLMQTVLMANAAKRNQEQRAQAQQPQQPREAARPRRARVVDAQVVEPAANMAPPPQAQATKPAKSALERDMEAKTEQFLELLLHEPLDELRALAPTLSAFFERLGEGSLDGERILQLIKEAETTVDREELMKVHTLVSAELATAFANLMMRAMSEQS